MTLSLAFPCAQSGQSSCGRPPATRRRDRAAPRSTDRVKPTVRGARAQPGLAAALVRDPPNLRQRTRNTASTALGLRAQSRPPGTEFLDAETGRQKWSFKRANARRDQNPRIEWPEIPAEPPHLASSQKRSVCKDWVVELAGLKLGSTTQSSNRSPPCAGNGNFLRRNRPAEAGSSPSRDRFRGAPEARKPQSPRTNCEIACEGLTPKTGWWAHQGSNLGPDD
jgi:hypothetical protein